MGNRRKLAGPPATRAVVEALMYTVDPGEPLPPWARNPRTLAEFTAALIIHDIPHEWRGDECVFALALREVGTP